MGFMIAGIALFAGLIGLFWLKDTVRRPWLARLAYSELTARLTVVALGLVIVGFFLLLGSMLQ